MKDMAMFALALSGFALGFVSHKAFTKSKVQVHYQEQILPHESDVWYTTADSTVHVRTACATVTIKVK